MGNLVVIVPRKVEAKGLNKNNVINEEKLKNYVFSEDIANFSLIDKIKKIKLRTNNPRLYYPGSGCDILWPLYFLDIFLELEDVQFIFVDHDNNLGLIKMILDDIGISFAEKDDSIMFYWKGIFIHLKFLADDVFSSLSSIPIFDIYFERSFRIMKSYHDDFEKNVYDKLNEGGVIVSDSGFRQFPLKKIKVSPELSFYREMIVGVKVR
jgi:hypothetical protein